MRTTQQLVRIADLDGGRYMPEKGESRTKFRARILEWEELQEADDDSGSTILGLIAAAERGAVPPPVFVVEQGGEQAVVDGFHRCCATVLRGRAAIRAIVVKVTSFIQADAVGELLFDLSTSGTPWQAQVEAVERLLAA